MLFELETMATILQLLLDTGQNVPPDAYPGAIPPGYGGFPPGSPGASLPNLPIPGDPDADEYRSASENCRNLYNGLNALAQDAGYHRMGPGGEVTLPLNKDTAQNINAMESCKKLGWRPEVL